jgi:transcription elongation GreA/GreB family factor
VSDNPISVASRPAVRVGEWVRYQDDDGSEEAIRIVPESESDLANGRVSVSAPLGRALVGRAAGDRVVARTPGGLRMLTIIRVGQERGRGRRCREPCR